MMALGGIFSAMQFYTLANALKIAGQSWQEKSGPETRRVFHSLYSITLAHEHRGRVGLHPSKTLRVCHNSPLPENAPFSSLAVFARFMMPGTSRVRKNCHVEQSETSLLASQDFGEDLHPIAG